MIDTFTYSPGDHSESKSPYTFAAINGKAYQIIRGYQLQHRDIWLQVAGTTALRPSDLGQHWEVVGSRGIHIAFVSRYFNYQSERADLQLAFIGNTTAGSRFLALWFLARRFGLSHSEEMLAALAQHECPYWDSFRYGTSYLEDFATNDQTRRAVCINFQSMNQEVAQEFLSSIENYEGEENE